MKSNASLLYGFVLVAGDFFALVAAFAGAYVLRGQFSNIPVAYPIPSETYVSAFFILLPFWILIFALLGLYSNAIQEKRFNELGRLFIGSFIGLLFIISYGYAVDRQIFPSRLVPVYGFSLAFLFLVIFRNLAREIRAYLYKYDIGITSLLIVGNTKVNDELVSSLSDSRVSGYRIIGLVGSNTDLKNKFPDLKIYSDFPEAISRIESSDIHSIVQTELFAKQADNSQILEYSQKNHISYRFVPGNSELFVGNIAVELFRSSIPVVAVHQTALIGWGRIAKRITDIILGIVALIIALPFMAVTALILKLSDMNAPVLYKFGRLSRFGSVVTIYKFRSIRPEFNQLSPEQAFTKMGKPELIKKYRDNGDQLDNDPRISGVGHFIRQTSLDELPQLWNVIKGDISFVGPRALEAAELNKYAKKDLILAVKSGLTGLAQVSGRRNISFEERRKLDLYYVQNWSLWLDLIIIVKTVRVVLGRIGAK